MRLPELVARSTWGERRFRSVLGRFLVLAAVAITVYLIAQRVTAVLSAQNIATGFGFLSRPARFQIGESLISFSATDSYGRALLVALLNTLQAGLLGCVLATVVGVIAGIARLSSNPLARRIAASYVELFRNTPVLLQLFFWYSTIQMLPPVRQSLSLFNVFFISQRGVQFPALRLEDPHFITLIAIAAIPALEFGPRLLGLSFGGRRFRFALSAPIVLLLFAYAAGAFSFSIDIPRLSGFGFEAGMSITPEFLALLIGLSLYTGAFIAEIVRGGIQSIPAGLTEAAHSLGLSGWQTLRLVTLPQAFRIIVPPLASEYLSLVKNSSLAVAIGYPDIVWAANAIINQTGQAIEGVLILAIVYLSFSLLTSFALNSFNAASRARAFAAGTYQPRLISSAKLFGNTAQTLVSTAIAFATGWAAIAAARWAIFNAVWEGGGKDCRAASGACWAFVGDKIGIFFFGLYPREALWRPALTALLIVALVALSMTTRFWRPSLAALWAATALACVWLMGGGVGLDYVPTASWGGLTVTLMLAVSALAIALPAGILLAVGRNSTVPAAQMISTGFIEIIRGVPLISILFLTNTLLPLFFAGGANLDKLLRAQIALTVFASAYLAEAVRAGLRAVSEGQLEAAHSLALSGLQILRLVVLPQAFRTALPGIVNTSIGILKDTSLVAIIGLLDFLGAVRTAGRDPAWLGFEIEGYLFAAAVYFVLCFAMSRYGLWLEFRNPGRTARTPIVDPA